MKMKTLVGLVILALLAGLVIGKCVGNRARPQGGPSVTSTPWP